MNTQTELAQVDAEIAELQAKLLKAQERRELLAAVKPACDSVLEAIDKALDILLLVELSSNFEVAEIAKFKSVINSKFKFAEERRMTRIENNALKAKFELMEEQLATQAERWQTEVKSLSVAKADSARKSSSDCVDKVMADKFFPDRPAQANQLHVIIHELKAIGIIVGKSIANRSDAKGWHLRWGQDKAGLYWTVGQGWVVEALKSGDELTGQWEGFDLDQHLECNDIDLEEYVA